MFVWEAVGWLGTAFYIVAYALLALRVLPAGQLFYVLNIIAAVFVVIVSVSKGSIQAVAINGLWAGASVYGFCGVSPPLFGLRPVMVRIVVAGLVGGGAVAALLIDPPLPGEWMAWGSVIGYTGAYVLFVGGRMRALEFHVFNLVSSIAILPALVFDSNLPVIALELVWAMAALAGIVTDIAASRRGDTSRP